MPKVFVGMSGGIDSSVAALLLKKEGHDVTGVTFTGLSEQGSRKCCSIEEIASAAKVCAFLGIPHRVCDLKDVFEARVIRYFTDSYKNGKTPNPCILCNRFVKFGALLEYSLSEGADVFATGHYARIVELNGDHFIRRGLDEKKDQSYFLSMIEKEKLRYVRLPLGEMKKPEVRAVAEREKLPIDPKKTESQDICFVKDDYRDFLALQGVKETHGDFVHDGKKIGMHRGVPFYSHGQRRGLNIAAGERVFVRELDAANNRVVLGAKPMTRDFTVGNVNAFRELKDGRTELQFRYQGKIAGAVIALRGDEINVRLDEPSEIVTPGQFAVFYEGDMVIAGGEIKMIRLLP